MFFIVPGSRPDIFIQPLLLSLAQCGWPSSLMACSVDDGTRADRVLQLTPRPKGNRFSDPSPDANHSPMFALGRDRYPSPDSSHASPHARASAVLSIGTMAPLHLLLLTQRPRLQELATTRRLMSPQLSSAPEPLLGETPCFSFTTT